MSSGAVGWTALARAITNPKQRNWKSLVKIAKWLAVYAEEDFSATQIAADIYKTTSSNRTKTIGRLISSLPQAPKAFATTRHIAGNKVRVRVRKTKALQRILQDHEVLIRCNDGNLKINRLITGNYTDDIGNLGLSYKGHKEPTETPVYSFFYSLKIIAR